MTPSANERIETESVRTLFESMKNGTFRRSMFPELSIKDMPALLARASSTESLSCYPSNPISSQFEPTCPEGMVALWLVEGFRTGNAFPSLNALCLTHGNSSSDWAGVSEKNQARVAEAYRRWWDRVKDDPSADAMKTDPLKGLGMSWY
jgi:hypothetical protein